MEDLLAKALTQQNAVAAVLAILLALALRELSRERTARIADLQAQASVAKALEANTRAVEALTRRPS